MLNIHLVFTAVAGLGLALILRARRVSRSARWWLRLTGVGLIAAAWCDHAAINAVPQGKLPGGGIALEGFQAVQGGSWMLPLVAIGVALAWDRWVLAHTARGGMNSDGVDGVASRVSVVTLMSAVAAGLPWSLSVVMDFVRARRAVLFAGDQASAPALAAVRAMSERGPRGRDR